MGELDERGNHCKAEVLKRLERIPDDEPLFLIRAQDGFACTVVRTWISLARYVINPGKLKSAEECLDLMTRWKTKKVPD